MKPRALIYMTGVCLLAAIAMTVQLSAQDKADNKTNHPSYRLIDLGTFGGAWSFVPSGPPLLKVLNNQGAVIALADTSTPDPYSPICLSPDCLVMHALKWGNGIKTDLGALPGVNGSVPIAINELNLTVGGSENGTIDSATGYPEYDAIVWNNGTLTNLGTFGGSDSIAFAVNDWGQVVGWALNTIPDSNTAGLGPCATLECWPASTEIRAFLWQNGRKQDLGTLGSGKDAAATLINDLGMVGGISYTNTIPSDLGVPTQDPFFWLTGRMTDLGTLGAGHYSYSNWMNIWGQTIGNSAPADSWYHGFLWNGGKMQDLGTPLGGSFSTANWINDVGQIVGDASLAGDQTYHAVLWVQGRATDLGVVSGAGCSVAESVNLIGQVVGDLANCTTGEDVSTFLWENGTMYDLNTLIPPGSGLTLTQVWQINDQGEIAGNATLANGDGHAFLLIPCDQNDPSGCHNSLANGATTLGSPDSLMKRGSSQATRNRLRSRVGQHRVPSQSGVPAN